jgi:hypothetical protein
MKEEQREWGGLNRRGWKERSGGSPLAWVCVHMAHVVVVVLLLSFGGIITYDQIKEGKHSRGI